MKVLRVYHAGRDAAHRERDAALTAAGVHVTLVVPRNWPEPGHEARQAGSLDSRFAVHELPVVRPGDVNRHVYADRAHLTALLEAVRPDVLDLHEEPFSAVVRQWLRATPPDLPVVTYTAQNIDKRFPPPFHWYERRALHRVQGIYPCSRQAASVVRGKGFHGAIEVVPLGVPGAMVLDAPRQPRPATEPVELLLAGRLVAEKGVLDAVQVLAAVHQVVPARLTLVGEGPDGAAAQQLAHDLGVGDRVELLGWRPAAELREVYRRADLVLVPSRSTATWVEQFGRVIVEGQAAGAVVAGYASGSIPEVAGPPAVLVPEGDVAALRSAVVALVTDPAEWSRRSEAGLRRARGMTWAAVAEQQRALYEKAVVMAPPAGQAPWRVPPRVRRSARQRAREEFGPTATTVAGARPFALRGVRRSALITDTVGALVDRA